MRFILGVIVGLIIVPVVVYFCVISGVAPVATAAAPLPFEKQLAKLALQAGIGDQSKVQPAIQATDENLLEGARVFHQDCAVCHGLIGLPETDIAKGMFPKPPQLFVHGVTDDPVGETYWKVANGIRLSGMPGFKGALTDQQLWQVSLMLAKADKLPAGAKEVLSRP